MTRDEHVHDEGLDELLGAYAVDAVDDLDRRRVEAYLAENPEARAEVWEMRQAAAMLSHPGSPAPDGVWDRIAGSLEERPPRFTGRLAEPKAPSRRWFAATLAAAAVLAVAVAGLAVALVRDDGPASPQAGDAIEEAYEAARDDPDGRLLSLTSEDLVLRADAVVGPDGEGFLAAGNLPELPATETYQLWGVYDDGDVISLGVVGNRPSIEPFNAAGELDTLAITREAAGGVVTSANDPLLVGTFD